MTIVLLQAWLLRTTLRVKVILKCSAQASVWIRKPVQTLQLHISFWGFKTEALCWWSCRPYFPSWSKFLALFSEQSVSEFFKTSIEWPPPWSLRGYNPCEGGLSSKCMWIGDIICKFLGLACWGLSIIALLWTSDCVRRFTNILPRMHV